MAQTQNMSLTARGTHSYLLVSKAVNYSNGIGTWETKMRQGKRKASFLSTSRNMTEMHAMRTRKRSTAEFISATATE